ncbi:hypothetical protein K5549_005030 [Capra hircus]|nr:hypothetical protein K5549_005030 [Capra hircus]
MLWRGRWEGGSCLGTHVHPWWIHVNVWQNQYSIVNLCSSLPEGYDCTAVFDLTFDGKTRVCHHPSVDVPYKHAKLISESDLVHNSEET